MAEKTCGKNTDGISCKLFKHTHNCPETGKPVGKCPKFANIAAAMVISQFGDCGDYEPYPPPVLLDALKRIANALNIDRECYACSGTGFVIDEVSGEATEESCDVCKGFGAICSQAAEIAREAIAEWEGGA